MNNIIPKTEWIKTWIENGVGWIQLSHENKLNPLQTILLNNVQHKNVALMPKSNFFYLE